MPRPRRVKNEALQPEEVSQPQNQQKVVEVKHKTEWSELRSVDEAPEGVGMDIAEDFEIEDDRPRRKTAKNERDELRKKLSQNNVTPASNLKLTIEKYSHSEVMDGAGGMSGDTEHCTKYPCVESHITSEDYLDIARKWGAGMFRFTLRMQNKIVTAWDKRISAGASAPMIQHVNPNDPTSPQVIIQSNGDGQQQPMSMREIMKAQKEAFKEQLEMAKLMREAYGLAPEQQQQQSKSEEEILASAILKQPDVIENVVGSVIKRFGGKGGEDDAPWYADIVRKAVESGQAAQIVQVAIDRIFNGVSGLFPGRQDNGQAPMGQTQVQTPHMDNSQHPQQPNHETQGTMPQAQLQGASSVVEAGAHASPGQQQQITPAEQALATVISDCQKKIPPQVTFTNLMAFADAVNDQAPAYSIDGWIEYFAGMPIDGALEFVKSQPNGEQVVSLPHAKEWCGELQRLIKESQEGDEE